MGLATHSRILAWEIPGTEESGRLQSLGSHRETERLNYHIVEMINSSFSGRTNHDNLSLNDDNKSSSGVIIVITTTIATVFLKFSCSMSHTVSSLYNNSAKYYKKILYYFIVCVLTPFFLLKIN